MTRKTFTATVSITVEEPEPGTAYTNEDFAYDLRDLPLSEVVPQQVVIVEVTPGAGQ